jgi:hypothetical protein
MISSEDKKMYRFNSPVLYLSEISLYKLIDECSAGRN